MSDTPPQADDELAGTEQPFVSHLLELRDRLVRAMAAIGVCAAILAIYPGPSELYDLLAAPLVAHLPVGATLIATSVISPFMVPLKILLMAAFLLALPVVLYQVWAFIAPGLYAHEKRLVMPWLSRAPCCFSLAWHFVTSLCLAKFLNSFKALPPKASLLRQTSRPI